MRARTSILLIIISVAAIAGVAYGSYRAKSQTNDLEKRVAAGELSLRGVNPIVLEIDARLLANANTRMDLIEAAVADWAQERDEVSAVIVVGSRARADTPADRWSDLDIILIVDDPEPYAESGAWISEFGTPALTFLEDTPSGQHERRVLYETGEDVYFPLFPLSALDRLGQSANAAALLARGYRVLVDKIGLEKRLRDVVDLAPISTLPTQADFDQLAGDCVRRHIG